MLIAINYNKVKGLILVTICYVFRSRTVGLLCKYNLVNTSIIIRIMGKILTQLDNNMLPSLWTVLIIYSLKYTCVIV